jgi:uncharacterized membrane protein YphA (DoxX/SURF4 family)
MHKGLAFQNSGNLKKTKRKEVIIEVISFLFIVLFVYAASSKLLHVEQIRVQIGQSPLLTNIASFAAWFIPVTEIRIALMLAILRFKLMALNGSFRLTVMFTTYIIVILNFREHVPCSCGGVFEKLGWTEHLIFNIGFTLLAAIGVVLSSRKINYKHGVISQLKLK